MEGFGPFLTLTSNIGFWGPKQKQKNKQKKQKLKLKEYRVGVSLYMGRDDVG